MPTYTVFADTTDGYINSGDATIPVPNYLNARAGTGTVALTVDTTAITTWFINSFNAATKSSVANYTIREDFWAFDTSTIPGSDTVNSATLSLFGGGARSIGGTVVGEIYTYDWGTSLTTADYVPGASIGALTRLATFAMGVAGANWNTAAYNVFTEDGTNFQGAINKGGSTRIMGTFDTVKGTTAPLVLNQISISSADEAGTTRDPKLVVVTTAAASVAHRLLTLGAG